MANENQLKRVLLVEDSENDIEITIEALSEYNLANHVDLVRDGAEALDYLFFRGAYAGRGGTTPVVVLLDVKLPKLNGIEVLKEIRADARYARLPVVMLTSSREEPDLRRSYELGCNAYVVKPVEPEALVELLHEVLAQTAVVRGIEVVSARPDWVELLVRCQRAEVDRIDSFMSHLEADLPADVRESIGYAFRELLMNAIEWGGGLDPSRTVRIAFLRAKRMLLYRIADPGPGFNVEGLSHAAIGQPEDDPIAHAIVREEKGLRPGGFGILSVRAQVDELLYNEKRNEVVFVKYLD